MPRRIGVAAAFVAALFVLPINAGAQLATPVHHRAQHHSAHGLSDLELRAARRR